MVALRDSLEDIQINYSVVWDRGRDRKSFWCSQCNSASKEVEEEVGSIDLSVASKILYHHRSSSSSPLHLHLHLNVFGKEEGEENNLDATVVHLLGQSAAYSILSIECCRPDGRIDRSCSAVEYLLSSVCSRACLPIFNHPLPPSLTELRISAEVCVGLIHTNWLAAEDGSGLSISRVRSLSISPECWLFPLWSSSGRPVNAGDLESLLAHLPCLTTLSLCTRCLIRCRGLELVLRACSRLRRLYLHSRAFESVQGVLAQLRLSAEHRRLEVLVLDCPYDITPYDLADVQKLPAVRYILLRLGSFIRLAAAWVVNLFDRLPSLEWFVYISPVECRTFVCSRISPGASLEFAELDTDRIPVLIQRLPQLLSVFWERLLDLA
ncbi:unnamed protein product [Dibothriocephalus latus]|uniref:F-box domain-containing protein n=1 Tax=Dibothriocephalus latus TaxID=60516 RepID=A0A3P7MBM4_DIBLA|nr:unnamed protein product [Dibothriocephalus latus]